MARKTYTPDVIAYALTTIKANDGNLKRAERDLRAQGYEVARSTLRAWRDGNVPKGAADQLAEPGTMTKAQTAVAGRFREIQNIYLDRARQPEVVAKTSAKDAVLIAAIADDKAFRAEGGPSERTQHDVKIALVAPDGLRALAVSIVAGKPRDGLMVRTSEGDADDQGSAPTAPLPLAG